MTPEAHTRKTLIDAQLHLAGWNLADATQVVEEFEIDLVAAGVASTVVGDQGFHAWGGSREGHCEACVVAAEVTDALFPSLLHRAFAGTL